MKDIRKKENSKFHRLICALFGGLVRLIYRLRVVGGENEPIAGGFLVCANHISAADPVIITAALGHQICFMGKKELFKIPLLSALMRGLGSFPVDRRGGDVGAVKHAIRLLGEGKCVGMFPQGTRHPGEAPRETEVKNGAAMIACRASADILPIYIHRKDNRPRLFRRTTVIIGTPISLKELGHDPEAKGEYTRLIAEVFDRICTLGEEMSSCQG